MDVPPRRVPMRISNAPTEGAIARRGPPSSRASRSATSCPRSMLAAGMRSGSGPSASHRIRTRADAGEVPAMLFGHPLAHP